VKQSSSEPVVVVVLVVIELPVTDVLPTAPFVVPTEDEIIFPLLSERENDDVVDVTNDGVCWMSVIIFIIIVVVSLIPLWMICTVASVLQMNCLRRTEMNRRPSNYTDIMLLLQHILLQRRV
jgi:hypothetical protein